MSYGVHHASVGGQLTQAEWEAQTSHQLYGANSFPVAPSEKDLCYRTDLHKWYIYNGSSWIDLTVASWVDQDVSTTASPTWVGATFTGLTASRLLQTNAGKALTSVADLTNWVAGTVNRISVGDDGDGTITLTTPQDLHAAATPQFARLYLDDANTYLDRDGANNMTFTDAVSGTKTLAELISGGAPVDATYVVISADATLTNEVLISALGVNDVAGTNWGIVGATGVLTIAGLTATANLDIGAFTITGTQFISDIAIGTPPLVVTSTTVVPNLNVDQTDGLDLPNTVANLLSDHNKALHDALGLSHDSLADVSTSDHHVLYTDAEAIAAVEGEATLILSGVVTFTNTGLHILDTGGDHDLILASGEDLSADRILTFTLGDAARTITLSGNPTLGDWFDQAVKQASSPTFNALTVTSIIIGANTLDTNEWAFLDGLDQALKQADSPTFAGLTTGEITSSSVNTLQPNADNTYITLFGALQWDDGAMLQIYGEDHASEGKVSIFLGGTKQAGTFGTFYIYDRTSGGVTTLLTLTGSMLTFGTQLTLGGAVLGAGYDLGTVASELGDIYVGDSKGIIFGDDQDFLLRWASASVAYLTASFVIDTSNYPQFEIRNADSLEMNIGITGTTFYFKETGGVLIAKFRKADNTDILEVDYGNVNVNVEGALLPFSVGGTDLGSTALELGDVFLADGKKIYFGNDQDYNISADTTREKFVFCGRADNWAREGYAAVGLCNDGVGEYVEFTFKVPDDFVSFTSVKIIWSSPSAAGNMRWYLGAMYGASGEDRSNHTDAPAQGQTATGGTDILNVQEPPNALTLANLAIGDYLGIMFYRAGGNALDTLNDEVYVYGLLFTYVAKVWVT